MASHSRKRKISWTSLLLRFPLKFQPKSKSCEAIQGDQKTLRVSRITAMHEMFKRQLKKVLNGGQIGTLPQRKYKDNTNLGSTTIITGRGNQELRIKTQKKAGIRYCNWCVPLLFPVFTPTKKWSQHPQWGKSHLVNLQTVDPLTFPKRMKMIAARCPYCQHPYPKSDQPLCQSWFGHVAIASSTWTTEIRLRDHEFSVELPNVTGKWHHHLLTGVEIWNQTCLVSQTMCLAPTCPIQIQDSLKVTVLFHSFSKWQRSSLEGKLLGNGQIAIVYLSLSGRS